MVTSYGICFECQEPTLCAELKAAAVYSDKYPRLLFRAFVCRACFGDTQRLFLTIETGESGKFELAA